MFRSSSGPSVIFATLICVTIAICSGTGGALAYTLEGSSWPGSTVAVRIQVGPSNIVLKDGSVSWNADAANAFALWNEQMARLKVSWTFAAPGAPTQNGDGINEVFFSSNIYGDSFDSNTLAITLINSSGSQMHECDVIFNTRNHFDSYYGGLMGNTMDFHRVALHEFGHVLGLDHPTGHADSIMTAFVDDTDTLQADDIAGIQVLYGKPLRAPGPTSNGRLVNISARMQVGTGNNVLISGFVVQGTRAKRVLIRALGPSTHLAGALANPILELRDNRTGALLQNNDNWRSNQQAEIIATGIPPGNNFESAIIRTLPANNSTYSAIVRGVNNTTGVGLLEVYDLDSTDPANSKLGNISARGNVGTRNNVLISGFAIVQPQPKRVVVRAIGPSTGLPGALANPTLELRNANGALLTSNDNYSYDYYVAIKHLAPTGNLESALSYMLAPGNYTAIVRGVGNTTGIGLVEVYGLE